MRKLLSLVLTIVLVAGCMSVSAVELFTDVPESEWAAPYIYNLVERGIVGGYGDGTFLPWNNVQRCEYAKMLVNISGTEIKSNSVSPYSDVPAKEWYFPFINSVSDFMTGYQSSDGTLHFSPEEPATREDVTVAMVKALKIDVSQYDNPTGYLAGKFSDWEGISSHNRAYIVASVENGIITGDANGTFRANDPILRAEVVAVLYRAFPDENNVQANSLE